MRFAHHQFTLKGAARNGNRPMQIKTKTREALRSYARTVGYRIRNRRKQLNLTMPEFQHRLDLLGLKAASSTILGWENGNRSVQLYLIPRSEEHTS